MAGFVKNFLSKNLRQPQKGLGSYIVKTFFIKQNSYLEVNAVKACHIQADDNVLEIGFGPGIGLESAYQYVKGGKGKIYGVEISQPMLDAANKRLQRQIQEGKVQIQLCDVINLPYQSHIFDHVFHCNCYYFWDDQVGCAKEILRVMKPGSRMITTINKDIVNTANEKGIMRHGNTNLDRYMVSLEKAGFIDIQSEQMKDMELKGKCYDIIYATAGNAD